MKIKKLIEILSTMDLNSEVVTSGYDHSYVNITRCTVVKAEDIDGDLYEYYDERNKHDKNSLIVPAVVLE